MNRWMIGLLALLIAMPSGFAQKDKKKDKGEKEEKFEKTGTSADAFLRSAFDLGQEMKKYNRSYEDASYYAYLLISNPAGAVGQDAAALVTAGRSAGTLPAKVDIKSLKDMAQSKSADLKAIKDAAVKNSLTQLVSSIQGMVESLGKMGPQAATLIAEAAALPSKLETEMTGLKKAGLPKVLGRVNDGKSNLTTLQTEAPALVTNIQELVGVLSLLVEMIGS